MLHPNFVILYVDNPARSAEFYSRLLDLQPLESSPAFAMFGMGGGLRLGLWSRDAVEPAAMAPGGAGELVFALPDSATLDECHRRWQALGLPLLQPPVEMDFGRTFVAQDPDGHRLRAYVPLQ
ncbi:VOC family protein [Chromobacterium sphagni]|uniref:Drug:proton antiporter n=1 Tax=Chromobacterium sphagni TaxID=1903179 RepID=A0A1S1WWL3_9NEIS|nr:VOC family protein [Chromobacterium sphagni]OHX11694.1 drug:proton antiporter [Chromobacterium sphagni]OHX11766.1 drug:proton antiporter [Chromobacterium sphagni]